LTLESNVGTVTGMGYTQVATRSGQPAKLVTETSTLRNPDKNNWETPSELFNGLNDTYQFDFDAAADQFNHKISRWFGPGSPVGVYDALAPDVRWRDYGEYFWLNPPYGRGLLEPFLAKAIQEWKRDGIGIVMLLPVDTSTRWWHTHIEEHNRDGNVRFLQGRIRFVGAAGSPKFASCLVELL